MREAYQPVIEDGRGRFPETLRVKAPRGAQAAIAAAAQIKNTTNADYLGRHTCAVLKRTA